MKAENTAGEVPHSAAMKKVASEAARPMSRARGSVAGGLGCARHRAALKAAAKSNRPTSGVGGLFSDQWSKAATQATPDRLLRPALEIHSTSRTSTTASSSQRWLWWVSTPRSGSTSATSALAGTSTTSAV